MPRSSSARSQRSCRILSCFSRSALLSALYCLLRAACILRFSFSRGVRPDGAPPDFGGRTGFTHRDVGFQRIGCGPGATHPVGAAHPRLTPGALAVVVLTAPRLALRLAAGRL
uniref:Uncharacterized protein n=1 Tax=Ixodes ricinus TaxID=34613 RepID=A0A6B0UK76_IXORI